MGVGSYGGKGSALWIMAAIGDVLEPGEHLILGRSYDNIILFPVFSVPEH